MCASKHLPMGKSQKMSLLPVQTVKIFPVKATPEELKERGFLLNPAYEDGSSDMVSSVSTGNAPSASAPVLPAAYDLRQSGRVSPVKNQGEQGLCWTFSTYASLESFLLSS